jgi:3-methyladenine DNA glycosylase AlkC
MAEPLKNFFDRSLVKDIGQSLQKAWAPFDLEAFVREAAAGLAALELKGRAAHIAQAMAQHLPQRRSGGVDFPRASRVLVDSLGDKHATDELEGAGMAPFFYLPHTTFVAEHGLEHVDVALDAQYEITQRFSCEFSIRAFLLHHPDATLARMATWVTDKSPHVRRLVSEGTRPRLPWATRVPLLDEHPERLLPLLEQLKDDPTTVVRRSVANHLNDLGKDHSDLFYATCAAWLNDASPERRALIEHALRSALKRAEPRALALIGAGAKPSVALVSSSFTPKRVAIGGKVRVSATLKSTAKKPQTLHIDLEVHFVKARGTSPKVFKLQHVTLLPGDDVALSKLVSLAVHTTRTPHPGKHDVALLVNGARVPLGSFQVTAD